MVVDTLKKALANNSKTPNKDYLRNLLKEELQVFVLNYIYTSSYKDLIFTGGTCLRKFYGLPRISEDLDFDMAGKDFDFKKFESDLLNYFKKDLQYKDISTRFKNQTFYLKFPLLRQIGFSGESDTDILFLRLDFAFDKAGYYGTEDQLFSSYDFSFLVKTYDFPTLVANKINAFLTREYKKGSEQAESFKGRDAFDLVWMLGEAKKTKTKTNLKRLKVLIGTENKQEVKDMILKKAEKIKAKDLKGDLKAFFADTTFVDSFCNNFVKLLKSNIDYL